MNEDELDEVEPDKQKPGSSRSRSKTDEKKAKGVFFKSWRKYNATRLPISSGKVKVREEAGMENGLLNRVRKMSFKVQVEAFYTAYSKASGEVLIFRDSTSNQQALSTCVCLSLRQPQHSLFSTTHLA